MIYMRRTEVYNQDGMLVEVLERPYTADEIKHELSITDRDMVRVIDDVINVLLAKGVIAETDLPAAVREKYHGRNKLRQALRGSV